MRSRRRYAKDMLAAAVLLLSPAYLQSCATGRRAGGAVGGGEKADSTEFVPLHPPVVVPHTWQEVRSSAAAKSAPECRWDDCPHRQISGGNRPLGRGGDQDARNYSHSMVAGGLEEMS